MPHYRSLNTNRIDTHNNNRIDTKAGFMVRARCSERACISGMIEARIRG